MNRSNSSAVVVGLPLVAVALCAACVRADLVTEYRYDTKMQMTQEFTYDSGQGGTTHSVSTYGYDELGRQELVERHATASLTPNSSDDHIALYVYDVAGNLSKLVYKGVGNSTLTSIQSGDVVTTYDYDALGRRITTTDASGGKTVYAYDLGGNATKQSVLLSGTTWADTVTEYDGLGRATRMTDPEGHYRDISYNSRSLRYLEIAKNGSGTALFRQRSYYDSLGRVTKEARYIDPADTGDPAVNEDQVSEYVYDSDGRVLTQTMYNRNSSTPLRTIHAYNVNGWLTKTTDPGGGYVENLPDATGTVTKRYVYDIIGTRTVELAYDPLDRLTKQTLKGATQANDIVTQYGYDGADRRTKMIDPDSRETTYAYDPLGRQTAVTEDSAGMIRVTTSIFDRLGRLDKLRAFDDDNNQDQDTEYKYDLAGRRTKIKYPDASGANDSVRYVYDSAGRMITRKTPNDGFIVLYAYDKRGLLTSKTDGTTAETYGYDGAGRMLTAKKGTSGNDDAVSEAVFAYDGLSRLTQETQELLEGTAKTLEYAYDQLGNRLTMKFEPSGANSLWLAYGYDDLSQNTSIQAKFRTARGNPSAYQDLITYDYQGRYLTQRRLLTRYKYESAYSTKDLYLDYRPEYDDQRFMTQVTNRTVYGTAQLDELAAFTYTFDRAGDRLSNVGNRASSSVTNAAGFSKIQRIDAYGYDTLHRLTQVDYNNTWQTANEDYVYDELGNRVTYSDHRNSITRAYANDKANQYTSIVSNGVTHTVTHDDAGNLASQVVNGSGDAYVYTYDCDNRLLKVDHDPATGGNVTVATFAYDALGRKITAWTKYDGATDSQTSDLRFYHDGQVEIADYNSDGSLARRFVNGTQYIDERAVLIEGEAGDNGAPVDAETFYYLLQELYTVTGLMKVNGTLTEAHTFDGYGKARLWHYSDGDFNRDGAVNATDQTRFTTALGPTPGNGKPATDPPADLDLDGDVDLTDSYAFTQIKNGGGALAELFTAATGNPFYFTGRRLYMLETLPESNTDPVANQQLQHNRARHYSPMEGRWLQRDPIDYSDSMVLFEYSTSAPLRFVDPLGRQVCKAIGRPPRPCEDPPYGEPRPGEVPAPLPPKKPVIPSGCKCCCCVENLQIANLQGWVSETWAGHKFDVIADLHYVQSTSSTFDCEMQWIERTNMPTVTDVLPGDWYDWTTREGHESFPTLAPWYERKKPCPGTESIAMTDFPNFHKIDGKDDDHYTRSRTLDIQVIVKSAQGCNCAKKSLSVEFHQVIREVDGRYVEVSPPVFP